MFENAVRIFSVRDFDVRVDPSWLIIAALVVWSLWSQLVTRYGHANGVALPLAVVGAVLFFASVLAHELAHALEGHHRGVEIGGITLFLFGGVTEARLDVDRPADEFTIAAVGPYTSFVIGAGLGLVVTGIHEATPLLSEAAVAALLPVADILGILGWINIGLGVFNLLPGAPLDGGRVLRSAIWRLTGDRDRSIAWAAYAGQGLGMLLIGAGLLQAFFTTQGFVGGLWLAFIGWFLFAAARGELAQRRIKLLLQHRSVGSLTLPLGASLPEDTSVAMATPELMRGAVDTVPVTRDGEVVGVVTVRDVARVDAADRPFRGLRDVMRPVGSLPTVDSSDPAYQVLDRMSGGPGGGRAGRDAPGDVVAVMEGKRLVGVMTAGRLREALERLRALEGARPPSGRRGSTGPAESTGGPPPGPGGGGSPGPDSPPPPGSRGTREGGWEPPPR